MKKYRSRKSPRAAWWNYGYAASYFITIVTKNRRHYFGQVRRSRAFASSGAFASSEDVASSGDVALQRPCLLLNSVGAIVQGCWHQIPQYYPQVRLGAFILMPNHLHGILHLMKDGCTKERMTSNFYSRISPQAGTVSAIIRSFKSASTRFIRKTHPELGFAWQGRYWDRMIRNEAEGQRISHYIQNNPQNWEADGFFTIG